MAEPSPTTTKKRRAGQFAPGKSGNPGGRPKEDPEVKEMARAHTKEAIQALLEVCKQKADRSARVRAAVALLDRGWGKPVQPIDTTPDGEMAQFFKALSQAASR